MIGPASSMSPVLQEVLDTIFDTLDKGAGQIRTIDGEVAAPVAVADQMDAAMHHLHRYVAEHPQDVCTATMAFCAVVSKEIRDTVKERCRAAGLPSGANVVALLECPHGTPHELAKLSARLVAHTEMLTTDDDEPTQEQVEDLQETSHILWHVFQANADAWKIAVGLVAIYFLRCRTGEMEFMEIQHDDGQAH